MIDFILASGSPRRKELLELIGLEFKVIVSQADEDSVSKDLKPELYVQDIKEEDSEPATSAKDIKSS